MTDIGRAREALLSRILEGDGRASRAQRRAAYDNTAIGEPIGTLIQKVAGHAYEVTDEDVAAARASGASEDEIFELVVCAAVGQAARQYEIALEALEAASEKE
ncbi:MAG TPA: hypothetical protein VKR80_00265 [Candidatus Limnocylindria bacterium]|nr:hypothetical protein [Candidatus Limnocylindria bacterium]